MRSWSATARYQLRARVVRFFLFALTQRNGDDIA